MWRQRILSYIQKLLCIPAPTPSSTGVSHVREQELVRTLRHLTEQDDVTVQDIMVKRADIISAAISSTKDQIIELFKKYHLSFVLLYEENQDNIVGGISCKNLFLSPHASLTDLIQPVLFISPTMRILDLLWKMRDVSHRYAIIVDEYGGVDGLVSFSDIVEKIIGTIKETQQVTFSYDGSVIVDGRTRLDELASLFGVSFVPKDLLEEDIETLGGLVTVIKGEVAKRGERISLLNGFDVEIVESDPRRVTLLALRKV